MSFYAKLQKSACFTKKKVNGTKWKCVFVLAFLDSQEKKNYIITHEFTHRQLLPSPKKVSPKKNRGNKKVALVKKVALAATAFVCTTDSSRVGRVPRAQVLEKTRVTNGRKWWRGKSLKCFNNASVDIGNHNH